MEARDRRIVQAWEKAEKEEQEINEEMIDDLMKAQAEACCQAQGRHWIPGLPGVLHGYPSCSHLWGSGQGHVM